MVSRLAKPTLVGLEKTSLISEIPGSHGDLESQTPQFATVRQRLASTA